MIVLNRFHDLRFALKAAQRIGIGVKGKVFNGNQLAGYNIPGFQHAGITPADFAQDLVSPEIFFKN
jgi:hypothetical protein